MGGLNVFEELLSRKENIAIVGLGYVGLPLALEFSKKVNVIGFDVNAEKINELENNKEYSGIRFTSDEMDIKNCICYIIAVPTPINSKSEPDLGCLVKATEIVAKCIKKGDYVIYESTVYPGTTEDVCIPIIENYSKLKFGIDFKIGYSPERINPGDNIHKLNNTVKIVSGNDEYALNEIAKLYELVIEKGVYKAESIKVAEAAKILENTQRDVNIALINEVTVLFEKMGISIYEVLNAASTKWNFVNYYPGLVGGHCIGVDPYYLISKAKDYDIPLNLIKQGRETNEYMTTFLYNKICEILTKNNKGKSDARVCVMGICFKENIDDIRNSKAGELVKKLKAEGINVEVVDTLADKNKVKKMYEIELKSINDIKNEDIIVMAVPHNNFNEIDIKELKLRNPNCLIMDFKRFYDKNSIQDVGLKYWSL